MSLKYIWSGSDRLSPRRGAVVGAKVPIALTSRSAAAEESFFSLVFCAVLNEWRKSQKP